MHRDWGNVTSGLQLVPCTSWHFWQTDPPGSSQLSLCMSGQEELKLSARQDVVGQSQRAASDAVTMPVCCCLSCTGRAVALELHARGSAPQPQQLTLLASRLQKTSYCRKRCSEAEPDMFMEPVMSTPPLGGRWSMQGVLPVWLMLLPLPLLPSAAAAP